MKQYDYIIAGGGLAGLSLAYYLNESPTLRNKKVLIIDKVIKKANDRTWCFWTDKEMVFDDIVIRKWQNIRFFGTNFQKEIDINPFYYKMIRGKDFYEFTQNKLKKNSNIDWLLGDVEGVVDLENGATVRVDGTDYFADFVFNSVFDVEEFKKQIDDKSAKYFYQLQHFKGWIIETEKAEFKPDEIHLMDFRTEQKDNARFFYVLPFSEKKALIEYTIFSDTLLEKSTYDDYLKSYISETLGIKNYKIEETEYGVIPMTNHPFKKNAGKHILNIGTVGGDVKMSSGYAFVRIQEATKKTVEHLEKTGNPFYKVATFEKRFNIYDTLILGILQSEGGLIKPIFSKLFEKNTIETVFNFLNEKTKLREELRLFYSLPNLPFWRSIFRVYFIKPIKGIFR